MADFWDELNGGAPQQSGDPFAQQLTDLYHRYGRPDPTAAEIQAHRGNPNGLSGVEQLLKSDNAAAAPPPPTAGGSMFGAPYAAFSPGADTSLGQMRTDYIAPQFTEVAPTFTAPTGVTMENDPGYQFRLDRAGQAVQRSAAMKGTVLNPGTVSALSDRVGQQASAEFGGVFDRAATTFDKALATYGAKYNVFQGNAGLKRDEFGVNNAAIGANNATAQQRFSNQATTYGINYGVQDKAQSDYWNRINDVANRGAQASAA